MKESMAVSARKNSLLLDGYDNVELRPGLYCLDVLGDRMQTGNSNSEWRRLGEALAQRLERHHQSAVLVSTYSLEHYLLDEACAADRANIDNAASFEHEGLRYLVTCLERTQLKQTLPDIVESEEFVFGLNVWLCFFGSDAEIPSNNAQTLCPPRSEDTPFVREMKLVISKLNVLDKIELSLELIAASSDGCELLWFNPHQI